MEFDIRPQDWPLIEAALRLGDWIAARPEVTQEQVEAVRIVQAALRRLPAVTPGLCASYGIYLHPPYERPEGVWRHWEVDLFPGRDGPPSLALGSIWTPEPRADDIRDEMEREFEFDLTAGRANQHDDYLLAEFIAEISDPGALLDDALVLEVEAGVTPWPPAGEAA